jgi:hypothetical protein
MAWRLGWEYVPTDEVAPGADGDGEAMWSIQCMPGSARSGEAQGKVLRRRSRVAGEAAHSPPRGRGPSSRLVCLLNPRCRKGVLERPGLKWENLRGSNRLDRECSV